MGKRHEQTLLQGRHPHGQLTHEKMLNKTHHPRNTNQNHNEIPPYLSEWLTLTTQATTDIGEDAEKEDLFCIAGGNASWYSHSGKQYGGSSKKVKIELPYVPAIALLGIYPQDTDVLFRRDTRTPMFIAALLTIAKVQKEPKCSLTDEWIKKMWFVYTYTHTHTHTHTHNGVLLGNQKE